MKSAVPEAAGVDMLLLFLVGLAGGCLGRWECQAVGPEQCSWWCWHWVVMVHWGSAPMALEQIKSSC